jgi:hypothetical protein
MKPKAAIVAAAALVTAAAVWFVLRGRPRAQESAAPPEAARGPSVPVGQRAPNARPRPDAAALDGAAAPGVAAPPRQPAPPEQPPEPGVPPVPPATPLQSRVAADFATALAAHRGKLAGCWRGKAGRIAVRAIFDAAGKATTIGFNAVPDHPTVGDCLNALDLPVRVPAPGEEVGVQIVIDLP